ncbi:MAG: hypothetical protein M1834_006900 [Cirrosporium novae-zelandiae]|nr:MAG: hypothetical protein M1834_006900 [Cirrosporium novae-zelandiae]
MDELAPINLQLGWPSPRLLPTVKLQQASITALSNPDLATAALLYGPDIGHGPLRKSIAAWLSDFYMPEAGRISEGRICITGGASQNLASILQVFTDPIYTRRIWMIEPTYFLACRIFEDSGFQGRLTGVPEDNEGLDVSFLEKAIEAVDHQTRPEEQSYKAGPRYPKLYKHIIYAVPTFSNPSAKTMSLARRIQLLQLARKFDALIITDDVYDFLRWPTDSKITNGYALPGPVPPRIVDLDRKLEGSGDWGNSVSNGSFSKLVGPGVRVGWAEGTEAFSSRLSIVGSTRSGGAPSQFTSVFIDDLLSTGDLQSHIASVLIPTYEKRYHVLMAAISKHLIPLGVKIDTGKPYESSLPTLGTESEGQEYQCFSGGFFIYITFPAELPPANVIAARALDNYALKIPYGTMFLAWGDKTKIENRNLIERSSRLTWAWHEENEIAEGVRRLAEVLKEFG